VSTNGEHRKQNDSSHKFYLKLIVGSLTYSQYKLIIDSKFYLKQSQHPVTSCYNTVSSKEQWHMNFLTVIHILNVQMPSAVNCIST